MIYDMKKVSFDFDSTLSREDVQDFAQELSYRGFDVWIVTSRARKIGNMDWNADLFYVANRLRIPNDKIVFTEGNMKADFFKENNDFIFHLDDDSVELNFINKETKVVGISCWKNNSWKEKCLKLI